MNRLFWGFFFALIDVKLSVGSAVFDLLPDFLGFWLVMKGMESLSEKSAHFDRGRHGAFGLSILGVILFGMELMDPDMAGKLWLWGLGLIAEAGVLVLLFLTVWGIRESYTDESVGRLRGLLAVLTVLQILAHLMSWVPVVGKICGAAALIGNVCFLAAFYGSVKAYQTK